MDLTKQQRKIVELLAEGYDNVEIADKLFIHYSTVKNHLYTIYERLGARNRQEVIVMYYKEKLKALEGVEKMDKIICLVGESGSGKTTVAEILQDQYGINVINSYTTRPRRYAGERGHIFVGIDDMPTLEEMIAYTFFDNHHYWATKEQYQGKEITLYVIDVAGVKELKEKVKDAEIIAIYLKCDRNVRRDRMFKRIRDKNLDAETTNAELGKAWDRLEHDKEAFKLIKCDYIVDANGSIEEVVSMVRGIINGLE
jgi:guanylate kinase